MKIATNLCLAVQMLAFSEGVLLAEKSGIPREKAVEVMLASVIASPMVAYRGPFVLGHPDEAWFDCHMMQKDMNLALELGRAARGAAADDRGHERAADRGARDGHRQTGLRGALRRARRDGGRRRPEMPSMSVAAEHDRRRAAIGDEPCARDVPADDHDPVCSRSR